MEYVYHGSSTSGLKVIYPHESTHGSYVYGTSDLVVATLFCKRCGDDVTYALFKAEDGKYNMIELLPGAFDKMFNNEASIYTVVGTSFKDYRTSFNEVMSTTPVKVVAEEFIPSVLTEVNRLSDTGDIHLYRYPNVPEKFNTEDYLIRQRFETYLKLHGEEKFINGVYRLAGYHPEMIDRINQEIKAHNINMPLITPESLINYYDYQLSAYNHDQTHERYLDSLFYMGYKYVPQIKEQMDELLNKHGYEYHSPINQELPKM